MTRTSGGGGAGPADATEFLAGRLEDLLERPGLIDDGDRAMVRAFAAHLRAHAGNVPADDLRRAAAVIRAGLRADLQRVGSAPPAPGDLAAGSGNGTRTAEPPAETPSRSATARRERPRRRRPLAPELEEHVAPQPHAAEPAGVVPEGGAHRLRDADLDLPAPTGPPVILANGARGAVVTESAPRVDEAPFVEPQPVADLAPLPWRMLLRPAFIGLAAIGAALALFVPYGIFATSFFQSRSQDTLRAAYHDQLGTPASAPKVSRPLAELVIPAIGVDQIVEEGVTPRALTRGPGFVPPPATSPQPPAIVIGAHRILYGGVFRRLGSLKPGDTVTIKTPQGVVATYAVERSENVSGAGPIQPPDGVQRVYLATASPPYAASRRLVVVAKRTDAGASLVASSPPPVELPSLTGSGGGIRVAGLVLLLLFVLASAQSLYATVLTARFRWLARLATAVTAVLAWQALLGGLSRLA